MRSSQRPPRLCVEHELEYEHRRRRVLCAEVVGATVRPRVRAFTVLKEDCYDDDRIAAGNTTHSRACIDIAVIRQRDWPRLPRSPRAVGYAEGRRVLLNSARLINPVGSTVYRFGH